MDAVVRFYRINYFICVADVHWYAHGAQKRRRSLITLNKLPREAANHINA
jgi:hypothetical protein